MSPANQVPLIITVYLYNPDSLPCLPRPRAMRIPWLVFCLLLGIPSFTKIMSNPDVNDESSSNDPGSDLDDDAAATQTAGKKNSLTLVKCRSAVWPNAKLQFQNGQYLGSQYLRI